MLNIPKDSVIGAIKQRWVKPIAQSEDFKVTADEFDLTAQRILDTMLTRQYRVTPYPSDEDYEYLLRRVRYWVQRSEPVRVRMGHGPMKNLNTTPHNRADWAEFFALGHLCSWHNKICSVYPPGIRVNYVFDDATIVMANQHDRSEMTRYIDSLWHLAQLLGYRSFINGFLRQSSFAWLFHFGLYQAAGWKVRRWERDSANRELQERMNASAQRNMILPDGLSVEEKRRRYEEASHRYRVYFQAMQMSGLPKLGHVVGATYLDGKQHHFPEPPVLHLTSLGKGQMAQPWQGEGALLDNGHGKLVPGVLTAERLQNLKIQRVEDLGILPLDGFDSIQVGVPRDGM